MRRIDERYHAFVVDRNGRLFVDTISGTPAKFYSYIQTGEATQFDPCTNLVELFRTLTLAPMVDD
jgi:hypothetical protein